MYDVIQKIEAAGIVGAGGAGFPSHVKAKCRAEILIANGAECEPLLMVDQCVMRDHPAEIAAGMRAVMQATGAAKGVLCTKAHYHDAVAALRETFKGQDDLSLKLFDSTYPAGDEQVMVYEVTGRVVPTGGLPIDVGAVVFNVSTLKNISDALNGIPVTEKTVTVAGEVKTPMTLTVPIGTPIQALIDLANGPKQAEGFVSILGGPCMGILERDWNVPVTKTTGGIIVIREDHPLVFTKTDDLQRDIKLAKAVCCQCSLCTQMCPRNALGLKVEPHKAMRAAANGNGMLLGDVNGVFSCCACGLCTYYACNFGLNPSAMMVRMKDGLARAGIKPVKRTAYPVASDYAMKKLPVMRLESRLGLTSFETDAPYIDAAIPVNRVVIPLKMHIGAPSEAVVTAGERVVKGQMIAKIPEGKLGANIHASIGGTVEAVDAVGIVIRRMV